MLPATNNYRTAIITAIRQEVDGVNTFTIRYEDGESIPYISGQFITLVFLHHDREERRSYSISSSHALGEQLSFTVKRIDNGAYSRLLHDRAAIGTKVFIAGVAGLFVLPEKIFPDEQLFFFAAGIGITPIFSLIKQLLSEHTEARAVLIYSNRTQDEVVFYDELNRLAEQYRDRFALEYLFSTAFNLSRARLNKALVPVLLNEYSTAPRSHTLCYVCGPYDYMRMVIWALEENGIDSERIRKENFNTTERPALMAEPPDKELHKVTIMHNGKSQTIDCQYPQTILQAAKQNHIALPYSCETGRCGSCAARCTSGLVWHSYNEVLMDMDLRHGSILTCTGYPVGGDVVIEV